MTEGEVQGALDVIPAFLLQLLNKGELNFGKFRARHYYSFDASGFNREFTFTH
ncbi:hypothetical protein MELB17_03395 [Marinobacter sp. ELB17]|nr:hypothetical protein MELB17_03395 [Marinobacter sp. ELB17]